MQTSSYGCFTGRDNVVDNYIKYLKKTIYLLSTSIKPICTAFKYYIGVQIKSKYLNCLLLSANITLYNEIYRNNKLINKWANKHTDKYSSYLEVAIIIFKQTYWDW